MAKHVNKKSKKAKAVFEHAHLPLEVGNLPFRFEMSLNKD